MSVALFFFCLFFLLKAEKIFGGDCTDNKDCVLPQGVGGLVCYEGECVECYDDDSCGPMYYDVCRTAVFPSFTEWEGEDSDYREDLNVCNKKNLWPPNWREIVATAVGVFGGCFASGAGIGGGGIYLPVYIIIAGYESITAAPLSTITIFGSAISNVALLLIQQHPHPEIKKPRIDYDLALILEPIVLAGTTVGVLFNVFFPKWLTLIVLVFTLSISSMRTLKKGFKQFKEFRARRKGGDDPDGPGGDGHGHHHHHGHGHGHGHHHHHDHHDHDHDHDHEHEDEPKEVPRDEDLDELLKKEAEVDDDLDLDLESEDTSDLIGITSTDESEDDDGVSDALDDLELEEGGDSVDDYTSSSAVEDDDDVVVVTEKPSSFMNLLNKYENFRVQPVQLIVLFGVWIFLFIVTLGKGSKKSPSIIGIDACGKEEWQVWAYWGITAASIPILVVTSLSVGGVLYTIHKKRIATGYKFFEGQTVQWTFKNSFFLPLFFFAAGIAAGLLGIGGGMVIAPLFIEIGVLPEVGSSTSALMILFTSSATVIQYFMMGALAWDYSLWFGIFGFFSSFIGRFVIGMLVTKLKSGFAITLIIGFTIMGATILMLTIGTIEIVQNILGKNWSEFSFKWMCSGTGCSMYDEVEVMSF